MAEIRGLIHGAILLAFALLLLRPHRWLGEAEKPLPTGPGPLLLLLMVAVGLWAGLIVLDSATYLLVALVLVGHLPLVQANGIKVVLIGTATVASLVVFIAHGQVDWMTGLPLMLGSALGGVAWGIPGSRPQCTVMDLSTAAVGPWPGGGGDAHPVAQGPLKQPRRWSVTAPRTTVHSPRSN
jgi:hypothetical protein